MSTIIANSDKENQPPQKLAIKALNNKRLPLKDLENLQVVDELNDESVVFSNVSSIVVNEPIENMDIRKSDQSLLNKKSSVRDKSSSQIVSQKTRQQIYDEKRERGRQLSQYRLPSGAKIIKKSKSKKAGTIFPIKRIIRYLQASVSQKRVNTNAGVYLAAVMEYLTSEILDLAGIETIKSKRSIIKPRDILIAIKKDQEISNFLANVTIANGGFIPSVYSNEEPKKKKMSKPKKAKKKVIAKQQKAVEPVDDEMAYRIDIREESPTVFSEAEMTTEMTEQPTQTVEEEFNEGDEEHSPDEIESEEKTEEEEEAQEDGAGGKRSSGSVNYGGTQEKSRSQSERKDRGERSEQGAGGGGSAGGDGGGGAGGKKRDDEDDDDRKKSTRKKEREESPETEETESEENIASSQGSIETPKKGRNQSQKEKREKEFIVQKAARIMGLRSGEARRARAESEQSTPVKKSKRRSSKAEDEEETPKKKGRPQKRSYSKTRKPSRSKTYEEEGEEEEEENEEEGEEEEEESPLRKAARIMGRYSGEVRQQRSGQQRGTKSRRKKQTSRRRNEETDVEAESEREMAEIEARPIGRKLSSKKPMDQSEEEPERTPRSQKRRPTKGTPRKKKPRAQSQEREEVSFESSPEKPKRSDLKSKKKLEEREKTPGPSETLPAGLKLLMDSEGRLIENIQEMNVRVERFIHMVSPMTTVSQTMRKPVVTTEPSTSKSHGLLFAFESKYNQKELINKLSQFFLKEQMVPFVAEENRKNEKAPSQPQTSQQEHQTPQQQSGEHKQPREKEQQTQTNQTSSSPGQKAMQVQTPASLQEENEDSGNVSGNESENNPEASYIRV